MAPVHGALIYDARTLACNLVEVNRFHYPATSLEGPLLLGGDSREDVESGGAAGGPARGD